MFDDIWRRRLKTVRTWLTLLTVCFVIGFVVVLISHAPAEHKRVVTVWGHQLKAPN